MSVIYTKTFCLEGVTLELTIDIDSADPSDPAASIAERIISGYPNTPHASLHCRLYREQKITMIEFGRRTGDGLRMYLAGIQRKA